MAQKSRVSYAKDLKAKAKETGNGMATISVTMPDGSRHEGQAVLGPLQCRFAAWAAAMLFCDEVRQLPDLESLINQLTEKK